MIPDYEIKGEWDGKCFLISVKFKITILRHTKKLYWLAEEMKLMSEKKLMEKAILHLLTVCSFGEKIFLKFSILIKYVFFNQLNNKNVLI